MNTYMKFEPNKSCCQLRFEIQLKNILGEQLNINWTT